MPADKSWPVAIALLVGDHEQRPDRRHAVERRVVTVREQDAERVVMRRRIAAVPVDRREMMPNRARHRRDVLRDLAQWQLENRREALRPRRIPDGGDWRERPR